MDQPLKRIPLTPEQFLQLQKQFSNIPVIDYDNQKKSGITGPVKLSDEQLKILLNQLQEKSIKSIKNNDDINSDKNNNNDNNDNNDINNQKNKDENIINNDIKILDNKEDVKPGQIPGQIPVTQSIGVEIIKMFFNESMNQTPWKCIGREGRLKKLSELTEKFKIAYETAKFLTDEQKKKIDTNLLNKHIPVFFLSYFGEDVTEQIMYIVGTYKELFSLFIKEINDKANVNKEESMKKPIKKVLFISDRLSSLSSVLKDRALVIIKMTDEKQLFSRVDYFSSLWKNSLRDYYANKGFGYHFENLYDELKDNGLSVDRNRLENWMKADEKTKFPMKKRDLLAIIKTVNHPELSNNIQNIFAIKTEYSGRMIKEGFEFSEEINTYILSKEKGRMLSWLSEKHIEEIISVGAPMRTIKEIKKQELEE